MDHYFAPLEGITDLTYRNIHYKYFPGIDHYFMPFISPTQNHCLTKKEQRELPNADSLPCRTIPQILTKSVEDFIWAAQCCIDRGYDEINLNAGCPSGTVVSKGKGSGMLSNLDIFKDFLDQIFSKCPIKISVKTRIGLDDPAEFPAILNLLNNYPLQELIIHPRVRKAFYKGNIDLRSFRYALANTNHSLCYNGDISSLEDIRWIETHFPAVSKVMIGRGLVTDPGMLIGTTDRKILSAFHEELFDTYCSIFGNKQNAMCRMKEIWSMMIHLFGNAHQQEKRLKRTNDYETFRSVAQEVLDHLPMVPVSPTLSDYGDYLL